MKKDYPKIIRFSRTTVATGKIERNLTQKVKNSKEEMQFWNIAASQEPNFKYEVEK